MIEMIDMRMKKAYMKKRVTKLLARRTDREFPISLQKISAVKQGVKTKYQISKNEQWNIWVSPRMKIIINRISRTRWFKLLLLTIMIFSQIHRIGIKIRLRIWRLSTKNSPSSIKNPAWTFSPKVKGKLQNKMSVDLKDLKKITHWKVWVQGLLILAIRGISRRWNFLNSETWKKALIY